MAGWANSQSNVSLHIPTEDLKISSAQTSDLLRFEEIKEDKHCIEKNLRMEIENTTGGKVKFSMGNISYIWLKNGGTINCL